MGLKPVETAENPGRTNLLGKAVVMGRYYTIVRYDDRDTITTVTHGTISTVR